MIYTVNIDFEGVIFEVQCWFEKGIKSNDRDTPDDKDNFQLEKIFYDSCDFTELLSKSTIDNLGVEASNKIIHNE